MTVQWIEETEDPVTGEQLRFVADSEAGLDRLVAEHFGHDQAGDGGGDEIKAHEIEAQKVQEGTYR